MLAALLAALATTAAPVKPAAQLFVTALDTRPGVRAETDVDLKLARTTTSAVVEVPAGYAVDLEARPGTVIGAAAASTLVVAAPGLWKANGLTVAVGRYADGGYRLQCSLAQPAGEIELDIQRGLTNPPRGIAIWRAFSNGTEVRSVVGFPQTLTAQASAGPTALRVTGKLLFAGKPRAGVSVHVATATRGDFQDVRELGSAITDAKGRYRFTAGVARGQLLLIAYVNFYVGLCADCPNESIAPPPPEVVALGSG